MHNFFNHIMVSEGQDIPNWILDESGCFTLKSGRTIFLDPGVPCGWGNSFGLYIFCLPKL